MSPLNEPPAQKLSRVYRMISFLQRVMPEQQRENDRRQAVRDTRSYRANVIPFRKPWRRR